MLTQTNIETLTSRQCFVSQPNTLYKQLIIWTFSNLSLLTISIDIDDRDQVLGQITN